MDPTAPPFGSARRGKGKGKKTDPKPPPAGARSATHEGAPTLSPIFMPQGPPSLKRPRSTTVSSLPHIDEQYLRDAPPSAYFLNLFHKINLELEIGATTANKDTVVMIEMIYQIHKDYRSAIDALSEQIEALTEELANTKEATPRPDTPTPIPFPLPTVAPSPATASNIRPLPLPIAAQPKSWATVARKGRKEKTTMAARAAQAPTKSNTNRPQPKKGLTARERRLVIKREGEPLDTNALDLRDDINQALAATYVQTVSLRGNTVTLTTMESVKAASLNSEVGSFLHLIPGTISVHLDAPVSHILVHGIPTSKTLAEIANELTTYNTGLSLTEQPRWLTTDGARAGKTASTVVINITGPRAADYVGKRLAAFSTTYRTERRLRFNSHTQCSNCHGYGHHNNKCTNPASCRWCASPHPTGGHTCPTATCRIRGRPCNHTVLRCVNCKGPHDAHTTSCPSHPKKPEEKGPDGDEEEMTT